MTEGALFFLKKFLGIAIKEIFLGKSIGLSWNLWWLVGYYARFLIDEKCTYSLETSSIKGFSFFYRNRELFWSVLVDPSSYAVINGEGSNFPKTSTLSMLSSIFIIVNTSAKCVKTSHEFKMKCWNETAFPFALIIEH